MKSSDLVLIVDSVEEAIKFYTEKLAFDLVEAQLNKEGSQSLVSAHLRKGKCTIASQVKGTHQRGSRSRRVLGQVIQIESLGTRARHTLLEI